MDSSLYKLTFFFIALSIVAAGINGVDGETMVSGTVFCDQCKDGQISLFDYPLHGIKVTMFCPSIDGKFTRWREETTNIFGSYNIRLDGTPSLSGCYAQISSNEQLSSDCSVSGGPPQYLRLMFKMFDLEMYTADPLLSQPEQPMSFCPKPQTPVVVPPPTPVVLHGPPPASPPLHFLPIVPVLPPPAIQLPPLPPMPFLPPLPPVPFLEASACPHHMWMMPQYRCHWNLVTPDTKVAIVFGLLAAQKYGTNLTLWRGMQGRGDPYRTLLREGTTALLNSYNSIQFPYHPLGVIQHMDWALMSSTSTRQVMHTALGFMRANSGRGTNATCTFTPCK